MEDVISCNPLVLLPFLLLLIYNNNKEVSLNHLALAH